MGPDSSTPAAPPCSTWATGPHYLDISRDLNHMLVLNSFVASGIKRLYTLSVLIQCSLLLHYYYLCHLGRIWV